MLKPIAAIVAGLIGVATVMCANSDVFVNVATFGADGSDYEDDTIAIQRAIDFATKDGRGDTVFFPKGRYIISSTIKIENTAGLTFKGAGSWATRFEWYGDDSSPMFLLRDVRDSVFENFGINATPDRTFLETAIQCENGPDNKIPPSHDIFRNIIMDGTNKGIGKGIRFALGAGGDNNNEFHHIDNVTVYNYTTAAFSLEHSQVKTVLFTNCNCLNGERCVATNQGEYGHGGSFFWYGGGGGYNRVADFDLGEADDIIVISGANFELSSSFLKTPGPSGSPWPVLIEGVRWESFGDRISKDGKVVDFRFSGPLTIRNSLFRIYNSNHNAQFWYSKGSDPQKTWGGFEFVGNSILGFSSNPFGLYYPTFQHGNMIESEDGAHKPLEEIPTRVLPGYTYLKANGYHTSPNIMILEEGNPISKILYGGNVGDTINILAEGTRTIVNGENILLKDRKNFTMRKGDTLVLMKFENGKWYETSRTIAH